MENEKLLPPGESAQTIPPPSHFHLENKLSSTAPASSPLVPPLVPLQKPIQPKPVAVKIAQVAPPPFSTPHGALSGTPSPKQQQWGVVISIVVIVSMIVVGAFYAWGKRIAQERAFTESFNSQ